MYCSRCGAAVAPGQNYCSCGEPVAQVSPDTDLPAEFYNRIESQVEQSGKDNFRRGLLIGLAFLVVFLVLETVLDIFLFARPALTFLALIAMVGLSAFNLWLFIRDRRTK